MLIYSHVPKAFSDTVLVPIVKNKNGDITDIDNYRTIAITSVASRSLEFGVLCCLTTPGLRKDIRRQIRQLYSHKITYYVHFFL